MKIETYIIAWNREDTIHLTIDYYKKLGRVILYDNFSDDRTREIAQSMGAEIQLFGNKGVLDDKAYKDLKNNCWKGSNADWVIIVDDDEILYSEDLIFILRQARLNGETIFKPKGFSIHSDSMPVHEWTELDKGIWDSNYSKQCIFNPKAIKEIGYEYGCHTHMNDCPNGNIKYSKMPLYLLHYRSIGGVQRLIDRWKLYEPRRQKSQINMRWDLGKQYKQALETGEISIRKEWEESLKNSITLFEAGII